MKNLFFFFAVGSMLLIAACTQPVTQTTTSPEEKMKEEKYTEQHRPKFHFTPDSMWMNDPNGMVYYEGEYHLFYQYYPDSNVWGPMHWGHAVSTDLVSWEHLPIGLYPDSLGLIFSGSAVVDKNNTAGFKKGAKDPLIAIFTHHMMAGERAGRNDFQYQSIAYSNDKGRTWTKYEGNPVIANPGMKDFRDPKVFWHVSTQQWVMIFAAGDHVRIYNSPNLKDWTFASEFGKNHGSHGGVWECPDLFELTDKKTQEKKWVMLLSINPGAPNGGSGTQYFLGDFNGKTFTASDTMTRWLDYGTDNYAGVTWSDVPAEDGRRLFIGWMSNWIYARTVPTERWRSAMTVPRTLELVQASDGLRLASQPVKELATLRVGDAQSIESFKSNESKSFDLKNGTGELMMRFETQGNFTFTLQNDAGETFKFMYEHSSNQFVTDRTNSGKVDFDADFPKKHLAPRHMTGDIHELKILIDHASIEIFADGGRTVITDLFFPNEDFNRLVITPNREMRMTEGKLYGLKTIW